MSESKMSLSKRLQCEKHVNHSLNGYAGQTPCCSTGFYANFRNGPGASLLLVSLYKRGN